LIVFLAQVFCGGHEISPKGGKLKRNRVFPPAGKRTFEVRLIGYANLVNSHTAELRDIPQQAKAGQARLCVLFHSFLPTGFWPLRAPRQSLTK